MPKRRQLGDTRKLVVRGEGLPLNLLCFECIAGHLSNEQHFVSAIVRRR